jgi:hypothetical protein
MKFNQRGAFRIRFGFQNLGIGDGSIGATRQTQRRVLLLMYNRCWGADQFKAITRQVKLKKIDRRINQFTDAASFARCLLLNLTAATMR